MGTLTDGSLHNHSIRVGGALAVSSSVHGLHPKHVVCLGGQAMAHKPENDTDRREKSLILSLLIYFIWYEL